jgi:dihydrofolate reductase
MISIIVAVSEDMGIGRNNDLLWQLPDDMKRFKKITMGKTVVMGRKTWESLPKRPLPGRRNIVITDVAGENFEGAEAVYSVEEAALRCQKEDEAFIIGGGSIYRQFMPVADRLYITHVHRSAPADIFFPEIDPHIWEPVEREDLLTNDPDPLPYSYVVYKRRSRK